MAANVEQVPDLAQLALLLRTRRRELDLTQTELAERLGWVQERISLLEHGKYGMPSLAGLVRLAQALDLPLSSIVKAAGFGDLAEDELTETSGPSGAAQYVLHALLAMEPISLDDALGQATNLLADVMAADKIDAFVYDPTDNTLFARGASDTPMGHHQRETGLDRIPADAPGKIPEVYKTGETFYTPDGNDQAGMLNGSNEVLGVRSLYAVPLQIGGRTRGVMVAQSAEPNRFDKQERRLFEAATRWVGMVALHAEMRQAMTESAATEARRLSAEQLITFLAHDLGNALTPVQGRLDMLRRRFERQGRADDLEAVEEVGRSMRRMHRMVNEMLDSARLEHGLFSLSCRGVDLVQLICEICNDLRGIHPDVRIQAPEKLEVEADATRISQVIENLAYNAARHAPPGSPVLIAAHVDHRPDGEWVLVSVHNDGTPIPAESLERLFLPYSSGPESSGLGLGLYLASQIARAHGGSLSVDSTAESGTTFVLSLPLVSR